MFTLGMACTPLDPASEMTADERRKWFHLSTCCVTLAIIFALVAAMRFFRQQYALMHGSARLGGWDFYFVPLAVFAVQVCVLVVALKY